MSAKPTVLVAMSGGVDSSTTAALLLEAGYAVRGVFMLLGQADAKRGGQLVPKPDAGADARRVAAVLDIELTELDCRPTLATVVDYFVAEYRRGRTPNPCVMCNRRLKFGKLLDYAAATGADYLATGHYARMVDTPQGPRLGRGVDVAKDQSYALFGMGRARQARVLLPLGEYRKPQVRALARQRNLPVHDKDESQEICFIPDDDYARVVAARAPDLVRPGPVVDKNGAILGQHEGVYKYTIGQRRGLGIALGAPAYVVSLDAATNTVVLAGRADLLAGQLLAEDVIWLIEPPSDAFDAVVQIRYNHRGAPARVTPLADDRARVDFVEPVSAVTPGQAAVFYDEAGLVIGGGWIAGGG